jgi:hypothetical protein
MKISPFTFVRCGIGMVQGTFLLLVIVIGFISILALMIESRYRSNWAVVEIQEQLDLMERGLEVVAGVLQQLPSLVPQFTVNESPLGQLLQFFKSMNPDEGGAVDSYANPLLAEDIEHGSTQAEEEI